MVIGVDSGALSIKDDRLKVGVYRVIVNLLQQLSKIDLHNEYRLYSFDAIDENLMNSFSTVMQNVILRPRKGWFALRLPLSLFIHPIDLFLGVSQAVPFGLQKNLGFIYDLGFIHYPDAYPHSHQKLLKQTENVIHRSQHIITISEASKSDICSIFKVPEDRVTVAYPGKDERFTKEGDLFKGNLPYFLHVGSLKPGKNIPTLIRAFREFLQQSQQQYLLLIIGGDYWLDEEILTTIEDCKLNESVRLLGYVPDNLLPMYYRGATAFVTASISEGFCLPVVEAMASGCPVIASKAGAFLEVAPEEEMLFDPKDVQGFAKGMEQITSNAELRDIVIAKGLAKSDDYTWQSFGETVFSVINKITTNG